MKVPSISVPGGIVAVTLFGAALGLTGCSSSSSSPSASPAAASTTTSTATPSSSSAPATTPATQPTTAPAMNLAQIAEYDYSSIAGTWKNALGYTITISGDTITGTGVTNTPRQDDVDEPYMTDTVNIMHYYQAWANVGSGTTTTPGTSSDYDGSPDLVFAPANVAVQSPPDPSETGSTADASNTSQDRIALTDHGVGVSPFVASNGLLDWIYYRVQ